METWQSRQTFTDNERFILKIISEHIQIKLMRCQVPTKRIIVN
jgi:hypothetical protein